MLNENAVTPDFLYGLLCSVTLTHSSHNLHCHNLFCYSIISYPLFVFQSAKYPWGAHTPPAITASPSDTCTCFNHFPPAKNRS